MRAWHHGWAAACLALACLLGDVNASWACRYNVRDVGFVDWDPAPYRLMALIDASVNKDWLATLRHTAAASFLESNVELTVQDSPSAAVLESYGIARLPALVLVAPDGRSIPLAVARDLPRTAIWEILEKAVSSPQRDKLLSRMVEAYAVVIVVEGADSRENERARQAAASAVKRITRLMERLPKAIKTPPEVMVIDQAAAVKEKVLLWGLGMDNSEQPVAQAAVLYGRARRVGPLLQGGLVTEPAIYQALAVLGQDCECDLDRAWMTGPLLPARWGTDQQTALQRQAGFDAENPMVKMEISRIIARGPSSAARTVGLGKRSPGLDLDGLGYSEISVDDLSAAAAAEQTAEQTANDIGQDASNELGSVSGEEAASSEPGPEREKPSATLALAADREPRSKVGNPWIAGVLLGIGAVGLGGGALLLWRARRRD